jgi:hypothetical protein
MKRAFFGFAFASLLALGGAARATTMLPLDMKALTDRADRVLYGVVESSTAHWTRDHDAIYTDVTVRVQRSYKGEVKPGEVVVVRREGGSLEGMGMKVFGAASFTVGEEVVVFVEQRSGASYVVGMAQGKLRVSTAANGGKVVMAPEVSGIDFLQTKLRQPVTMRSRALEDFEAELKTLLRVQPGVK